MTISHKFRGIGGTIFWIGVAYTLSSQFWVVNFENPIVLMLPGLISIFLGLILKSFTPHNDEETTSAYEGSSAFKKIFLILILLISLIVIVIAGLKVL